MSTSSLPRNVIVVAVSFTPSLQDETRAHRLQAGGNVGSVILKDIVAAGLSVTATKRHGSSAEFP